MIKNYIFRGLSVNNSIRKRLEGVVTSFNGDTLYQVKDILRVNKFKAKEYSSELDDFVFS